MSVPLPNCYKNWPDIQLRLNNLRDHPNWANLERVILDFCNQTKKVAGSWETPETTTFPDEFDPTIAIRELPNLQKIAETTEDFYSEFIPRLVELSLELSSLFPNSKLCVLKGKSNDRLELTRKQVACLLAHMFFGVFQPLSKSTNLKGHLVGESCPTGPLTFRDWVSWRYTTGPSDAYLRNLIHYFKVVFDEDPTALNSDKIVFQRLTLTSEIRPYESKKRLVNVCVDLNGLIGDEKNGVEIDFANKNVGFGGGGTQEELLLGMSPETCVVVLFNETLDPNDALLIQGARRFGTYSGYALDVKYQGPFNEYRNWEDRMILAMDAIPHPGDTPLQVSDGLLLREITKAFVAFNAASGRTVETGFWGCGAFGGDMKVKSLVQVIAASMAELEALKFYCFGDKKFKVSFEKCMNLMQARQLTVKDVWNLIKEFELHHETLGWGRFDGRRSNGIGLIEWIIKSLS